MERNTETKEAKDPKAKRDFDWVDLGLQLGIYVIQGACFAAGGMAVNGLSGSLSSAKPRDVAEPNVVQLKSRMNG